MMGFPHDLSGREVLCFLVEQGSRSWKSTVVVNIRFNNRRLAQRRRRRRDDVGA
jgi:hypothetical protein